MPNTDRERDEKLIQILWDLSNDMLRIEKKLHKKGLLIADYGEARENLIHKFYDKISAGWVRKESVKPDTELVEIIKNNLDKEIIDTWHQIEKHLAQAITSAGYKKGKG